MRVEITGMVETSRGSSRILETAIIATPLIPDKTNSFVVTTETSLPALRGFQAGIGMFSLIEHLTPFCMNIPA